MASKIKWIRYNISRQDADNTHRHTTSDTHGPGVQAIFTVEILVGWGNNAGHRVGGIW